MSNKNNITTLKEYAKAKYGEFLDSEYIDCKFSHSWKCKEEHTWKASWSNIRRGHWCPFCKGQRIKFSYLQDYANNKHGKLISKEEDYKGNKKRLEWECKSGHRFMSNWANVQNGKWCPTCAKNKKPEKRELRNFAINISGDLLSDKYLNAHSKLSWKCELGHEFYSNWNNVQNGKWCPICAASGPSKSELEILEFFKFHFKSSKSVRMREIFDTKSNLQLDVFVPELNLAIEYCGLYWHNEQSPEPRNKDYHNYKRQLCENNGIRLITIFEDEWKYRRTQVVGFLNSIIGNNLDTIFARKCEIREIDAKLANNFFEDNHIQGKTSIEYSVGLFFKNELVSTMSLGKHHRNGIDFVLNRFAVKIGIHIPGGASKLLNNIKEYCRSKSISKVISWSDNRWSIGNVYEKMGFTLESELGPDYSYVKLSHPDTRISKQNCRKSELSKRGATGKTEFEMANSLGLSRIWDCGKKRWTLKLTD